MDYLDYQTWCKESDKTIEKEKLKNKKKYDDSIKKNLKDIEEYKKIYGNYWRYDLADIYVPIEILSIPALDKVNRVSLFFTNFNNNFEYLVTTTELMTTQEHYTIEEYHSKFGKYDLETNRWIFDKKKY